MTYIIQSPPAYATGMHYAIDHNSISLALGAATEYDDLDAAMVTAAYLQEGDQQHESVYGHASNPWTVVQLE